MARTTEIIQEKIIAKLAGYGIAVSNSMYSRRRMETFAVANAIHDLEELFDIYKAETDMRIKQQVPPREQWYVNKLKAYQHGFSLLPETDTYSNIGYTDEQIAASKIVKYASVKETENAAGKLFLRIKLAGEAANELRQLNSSELAGVLAYFKRFKPLGVKSIVESGPADKLKQRWKIFYNPLILDQNGARLDGTDSQPVQKAIKGFLKNMPFNSLYVNAFHVDAVQAVDGVVFPHLESCSIAFGLFPYQAVNIQHTPDSGWLRFYNPTDLEVEFIPQQ